MKILTLLLTASLVLTACGNQSRLSEVKEGVDITKNPLQAFGELARTGDDLKKLEGELDNLTPVEPVHFSELMTMLPSAPAGWEAEKPQGSSNSMGKFQVSHAKRSYRQGDKTIKVEITDWAYAKALYVPFLMSARFSQESTEGYNKGIEIDGAPGREEYKFDSKRGELNVLASKRFFVQIEGRDIEPEVLRQWWQRVSGNVMEAKAL